VIVYFVFVMALQCSNNHENILHVYFHSYEMWDDICPPARNDKFHVSFVHGDKANKVMFIVF
jgi:hypothetical protein